MEFLNENDYLNINQVRNRYNTSEFDYNCGGYALGTYSWYEPDVSDLWEDLRDLVIQKGYNNAIVYALNICVDAILNDFYDSIRIIQLSFCNHKNIEKELLSKINLNEELIAFRLGVHLDEDDSDIDDIDFHFRVFRNGQWSEKPGHFSITNCIFTEEEWISNCIYDSPIYYLAKKIA